MKHMKKAYDCGLIIKELREKANMTQQELKRKIYRDKGIISRYENNYQPVSFETMRTFAAIFNVSTDCLAGIPYCHKCRRTPRRLFSLRMDRRSL